jgi:hypothetical protein
MTCSGSCRTGREWIGTMVVVVMLPRFDELIMEATITHRPDTGLTP